MVDTVITLGDFVFADTEVPAEIPFGGDQMLAVKQLVGGARVIDALGPSPMPLEWSGLIRGENALDRALYLDGLRKAGQPLDLTWDRLYYRVIVRQFRCPFQRFYQLPYTIVCEVIEDLTDPVRSIAAPNVDSAIGDDVDGGQSIVDSLGIPALSASYTAVKGAITAVSTFASATQAQINAVLAPIAEMREEVSTLIASATNTIQNVTTVGGILPNNPIAKQASRLSDQVIAVTQSEQLVRLDSVLGRISTNVSSVNSSSKSLTTAGGDLYRIASEQYGDAMGWTNIAQANGIRDPKLSGVKTLVIPPRNTDSGGVLNG
jgi:hypothetical protein